MSLDNTAYIGLGSNLSSPSSQLDQSVASLNDHPDINIIRVSSWYQSKAVGPGEQPDYINGVVGIHTSLAATDLLDAMQSIENKQGRVRAEKWGARTLDLDLLWFNGENIDTPRLQVPHPRIIERNFVLFPLRDIAPELIIDGQHTVDYFASRIGHEGIWQR